MSGKLSIQVLGEIVASRAGERIPLGPQQRKVVLGVLALRAGHIVTVDRITEVMWGLTPPPSARQTLQSHISRLRRALRRNGAPESSPIETVGDGYRLLVDPGCVDALAFLAAVQRARHAEGAEAHRLYGNALRLWAADPHVLSRYSPSLVEGLIETRLQAEEERLQLQLDQGGHREAIAPLFTLVADHPLRSTLVGQLMVALSRDGRVSEALTAFDRHRTILVDETGLDPAAELCDLRQAVLLDEVARAGAVDAPPQACSASMVRRAVAGDCSILPSRIWST